MHALHFITHRIASPSSTTPHHTTPHHNPHHTTPVCHMWCVLLHGGGRGVRRCWVNVYCRGVLQNLNLDNCRARAYCNRCGWWLFVHFFLSSIFSLFFLPLRETARYRLKYCLKGPLNPKQPTNFFTHAPSLG